MKTVYSNFHVDTNTGNANREKISSMASELSGVQTVFLPDSIVTAAFFDINANCGFLDKNWRYLAKIISENKRDIENNKDSDVVMHIKGKFCYDIVESDSGLFSARFGGWFFATAQHKVVTIHELHMYSSIDESEYNYERYLNDNLYKKQSKKPDSLFRKILSTLTKTSLFLFLVGFVLAFPLSFVYGTVLFLYVLLDFLLFLVLWSIYGVIYGLKEWKTESYPYKANLIVAKK